MHNAEQISQPRTRNVLVRYFSRFDDALVVKWAFRGLLVGTVGVLALDLSNLIEQNGGLWANDARAATEISEPVLPPQVRTDAPAEPSGGDPRQFITTEEAALQRPIRFELGSGGVLSATGTIDHGAAARFAAELEARGEYVKTVSLDSPGGSLDDAMEMARLIRKLGLATSVENGAICASSCPLLFAGGVERHAGDRAAIGVHQFYAQLGSEQEAPEQVMADAQITTARISRHLSDMGVDPALWLHALETPPRALYYLSPKELAQYRLVTRPVAVARN